MKSEQQKIDALERRSRKKALPGDIVHLDPISLWSNPPNSEETAYLGVINDRSCMILSFTIINGWKYCFIVADDSIGWVALVQMGK